MTKLAIKWDKHRLNNWSKSWLEDRIGSRTVIISRPRYRAHKAFWSCGVVSKNNQQSNQPQHWLVEMVIDRYFMFLHDEKRNGKPNEIAHKCLKVWQHLAGPCAWYRHTQTHWQIFHIAQRRGITLPTVLCYTSNILKGGGIFKMTNTCVCVQQRAAGPAQTNRELGINAF